MRTVNISELYMLFSAHMVVFSRRRMIEGGWGINLSTIMPWYCILYVYIYLHALGLCVCLWLQYIHLVHICIEYLSLLRFDLESINLLFWSIYCNLFINGRRQKC